VANLSKTLHANFYQNRSTFAEVMHKSILVCFSCPTCCWLLLCRKVVYILWSPMVCRCLSSMLLQINSLRVEPNHCQRVNYLDVHSVGHFCCFAAVSDCIPWSVW